MVQKQYQGNQEGKHAKAVNKCLEDCYGQHIDGLEQPQAAPPPLLGGIASLAIANGLSRAGEWLLVQVAVLAAALPGTEVAVTGR